MKTATMNSNISLSILLCALIFHGLSFTAFAQPQYIQVGTLPAPTATERGEVFDTATGTLFSFIYWTHSGAGGNSSDVYSSKVAGDAFSWTQTTSSPTENYWGRGCSDGRNLYFNGTIESLAVSRFAPIRSDGTLGSWQNTTPIPSINGARSLHQTFIYNGKLYILGGWHGDGLPAFSDVSYAAIQSNGALGNFVQTTSLPEGVVSHSATVSPDGKVYVVNNTNLFVGQITGDGSIASWVPQPVIAGLSHNNLGNTGIGLVSNLLVIVDYTNTIVCRLGASGQVDSVAATIPNPGYLGERSVYANNGKIYVTATPSVAGGSGNIYRIDGLPEFPGAYTNLVLSLDGNGSYVRAG